MICRTDCGLPIQAAICCDLAPTSARDAAEIQHANVAKLVDALDLGSSGVTRGSSSLPIRTSVQPFLQALLLNGLFNGQTDLLMLCHGAAFVGSDMNFLLIQPFLR